MWTRKDCVAFFVLGFGCWGFFALIIFSVLRRFCGSISDLYFSYH